MESVKSIVNNNNNNPNQPPLDRRGKASDLKVSGGAAHRQGEITKAVASGAEGDARLEMLAGNNVT